MKKKKINIYIYICMIFKKNVIKKKFKKKYLNIHIY